MNVALVSGASGGFGQVITQALLGDGWRVYAGARAPDPQDPLAPQCVPLALDVTEQGQVELAIETIERREGRLDALIHCAGVDRAGAFEDLSMRDWRELMDVNFFGAVALTRAALPLLRSHGKAVVVVLSSLSGWVGLPGNSAYAASKFALEGAFESLRYEVKRFGVQVALIEPGAYATGMALRYAASPAIPGDSPYASLVAATLRARAGGAAGADPKELAELVLAVIAEGAPQLHNPAGEQAGKVRDRLKSMTAEQREQFIMDISGDGK